VPQSLHTHTTFCFCFRQRHYHPVSTTTATIAPVSAATLLNVTIERELNVDLSVVLSSTQTLQAAETKDTALDPNECGLTFPNLTCLYHRQPYIARPLPTCAINLAHVNETILHTTGSVDVAPDDGSDIRGKRERRVFYICDIPPHPKLKTIHVGRNLLDRTDLQKLFDIRLNDYPVLEIIVGAEKHLPVANLGTLDLNLDAGQHICLGDLAQ
jgi:hypothetical protein